VTEDQRPRGAGGDPFARLLPGLSTRRRVLPGGSVTFDFGVYGVLPGRPYDCLVNGERCS
jgi:hypothetical protein